MAEGIICGDFDFPFIKCPEGYVSGETVKEHIQARHLHSIMGNLFFIQVIEKPARQNILDLLCTNNKESVLDYRVEEAKFSDHNLVQ